MKKSLFLLVVIFLIGCGPSIKHIDGIVSNIEKDFPVTEKLDFHKFAGFPITETGFSVIKDSTLWLMSFESNNTVGTCYHLYNGEKIADVAFMGRAQNEISSLDIFQILDDVVAIQSGYLLKMFDTQQILDNVPMEDRHVSIVNVPDSMPCRYMWKLPNSTSVIATLDVEMRGANLSVSKIPMIVLDGKNIRSFQTFDTDSFGWDVDDDTKKAALKLVQREFAQGEMVFRKDSVGAHFMNGQFVFYTFDVNQGTVLNEKRYTEVGCSDDGSRLTNEQGLSVVWAKASSQHIVCLVKGYLTTADREAKLSKTALYVFDWNLNPLKKFDLSPIERGYYVVDEELKNVYSCEFDEGGLTLNKAPLVL